MNPRPCTEKARLDTVELPVGTVIHFTAIESGVFFVCRKEREKGDLWSEYGDLVTCPHCLAWIAKEGEPK